MIKPSHEPRMREALQLARKGLGLTRPNPAVGALLVKGATTVGAAYHHKAGAPHAEILALREAGNRAKGSTLYVTLEPCSTWGRTPPCTDAVIDAGISEVVVACRDPNPLHSGRGIQLLRKHGIKVIEGVCASEAKALIAPFSKWILTKRPYVTLKLASTMDGRIADRDGHSRWITGSQSRERVHEYRRQADAVVVGIRTAIADNPSLLPVRPKGRKPYRIIVDTAGRLPVGAKCLSDDHVSQTIVATTSLAGSAFFNRVHATGASVLVIPSKGMHVSLKALMKRLGEMGLLHVLCEGGGELAASLVREKLVDEILLFVGPTMLGGGSTPVIGGEGWSLAAAPRFAIASVEQLGSDLLIHATMRCENV